MKQFFKYVLATITGLIILNIIGFLILCGVIGAMAAMGDTPTKVSTKSVYQIDLQGELLDRTKEDPLAVLSQLSGQDASTLGLDEVLANITKAKNDANIAGIYLRAGNSFSAGFASLREIRNALTDFQQSGKFIVAYADSYSQGQYYLCSVADKIIANPQGVVEWQGLASQTPFFKSALDKLGVEVQVVRVGTFKSAVEPFTADKMSDANRQQVIAYVSSIWQTMLGEVSVSRQISVDSLNLFADEVLAFQPMEKVLKTKMIDTLLYVDGIDGVINQYLENPDSTEVKYLTHSKMTKVPVIEKYHREKIAVLYAVGDIADSGKGIVFDELNKDIEKIYKDKNIKAVVLRVNSPGGSAYASEQIWRAISRLKEKKPVIVSMGDYAASGGYYISCNADWIVAQPNTLTGSIGIFGLIPNVQGLTKKIGVSFDGVKTNKMSDLIAFNRPFTPKERNLIQAYINRGYELFTTRCAEGRQMPVDSLLKIAEGRVWTGEAALKLGLVDELGDLQQAIKIAAERAEIAEYRVVEYPAKETMQQQLFKLFSGEEAKTKFIKAYLGENYKLIETLKNVENMNVIQARMPYEINIR